MCVTCFQFYRNPQLGDYGLLRDNKVLKEQFFLMVGLLNYFIIYFSILYYYINISSWGHTGKKRLGFDGGVLVNLLRDELSWLALLSTKHNLARVRESQLKNYFYKAGLCTCMWGIFLFAN